MPKKKITAKDWNARINRAKRVKEEWRKRFRIDLAYEYWEGAQRPSHIPDEEWITINMIWSSLQSELPTLYQSDPYFYVKLKKARTTNPAEIEQMEAKAHVRQSMLNYLKGELNLKAKARLSVFDAFLQFGVAKIWHYAELVDNPNAGMPLTTMIEGMELPIIDPASGEVALEPDQLPANEAYKIDRIHPDDFLVDENAGPLDDDVSWKAQRIKRPLEDAKADKRYNAGARRKLTATEMSDEAQKQREQRKKGGLATGNEGDPEPDTVVLWELYDIKNKQWMVLAEGCEDYLLDPSPLPPGMEQDPFVDLRFCLRDDSWYPIPPVSQWLDSQREYCLSRSKRMVHRKRFNRKYVVYSMAFEDPEKATADLVNGDDGTVIIANQPANTAVAPIQDAPLDQQEIMEYSYLRQDFGDLTGAGANQRGSSQGVDSATEAGILEKRAVIREGDKIGLVMDFITNLARKLDQQVQANITEDQAIKIDGPEGAMWQSVKTTDYDEIAGEYEYSINVGAETPQLPEIERAQLLAALGLFSANPMLLLSRNLTKKILELHHIYDDRIIDELQTIAKMMAGGQLPMPGGQGSQPNVTQQNPQAITGGMAAGMNNIRGGAQ